MHAAHLKTKKTPVAAEYDGTCRMKEVMAESMTCPVMPPWVSRRTSFSLRIHCSRTCLILGYTYSHTLPH